MRLVTCSTLLALMFCIGTAALADGCYMPKIDPKSEARDITEPTQKAFIAHFDGKEQMILEVSYKGDASEFVWLVPTPARPKVDAYVGSVFEELHRMTAPRVRYWLDADRICFELGAFGMFAARRPKIVPEDVQVLERRQIGAYDTAVLKARTGKGLLDWLQTNKYRLKPEVGPILDDYARRGWMFTAMRVNTGQRGDIQGLLPSMQFLFPTKEAVYPLKVSSLNPGKTKILLYVAADHRVDGGPLATDCVSKPATRRGAFDAGEGYPITDWSAQRRGFLTRLSGTLSASDMNADLALPPAASDKLAARAGVSAGFLENVSAVAMIPVAVVFGMPFWIIGFAVTIYIGHRKRGERFNLLAALVFLLGAAMSAMIGSPFLYIFGWIDRAGYWPWGPVFLAALAVCTVLLVGWLRTDTKKPEAAK